MSEKMTQNQRLGCLVEEFKTNSNGYKDLQVPADADGKRRILRSLMNIRMPRRMNEAVLRIQDECLKKRIRENGIVKLADIPVMRGGISARQDDITRLAADAIVNVTNLWILGCSIPMHACIDNCIHTFTGVQLRARYRRQMNRLQERYDRDYEQPTAIPMLTDIYNLPAKKVVYIIGPIIRYELMPRLKQDLADCYRNTLNTYIDHNFVNVAFCHASMDVFRFPNKRAAETATRTVSKWMREHPGCMEGVVFSVSRDEGRKYYEGLV